MQVATVVDREAEPVPLGGSWLRNRARVDGLELTLRGERLEIVAGVGRDATCGDLRLPLLVDGRVRAQTIVVPPPGEFTPDDVREMWRVAQRRAARVLALGGSAVDGRQPHAPVEGLDWGMVARALELARQMLARWPRSSVTRGRMATVEQPIGREDAVATERALSAGASAAAIGVGGAPVAEQAIYLTVRQEPWHSGELAAALRSLLRTLRDVGVSPQVFYPLVESIRLAEHRQGIRDRPMSSWPSVASMLAVAARRAVRVAARATSDGSLGLPIVKLWKLYEDWVGERLLAEMVERLGPGSGRNPIRWQRGSLQVELHHQPQFEWPRAKRLCGVGWTAAAHGALRPDYVLAGRRGAHTVTWALDAKAMTVIEPDDVAEKAGKYLAALRPTGAVGLEAEGREADATVTWLDRVCLVAPVEVTGLRDGRRLPRPPLASENHRRTLVATATPSTFGDPIGQLVERFLERA